MINRHRRIGIIFPFKEDESGFLELSRTSREATKSNLFHLLNTRKGDRYYHPDFGVDLLKYLFQPIDQQTFDEISTDIKTIVKKYLFNIDITNVNQMVDETKNLIGINIEYTVTDGFLKEQDFIEITY